MHEESPVTDLRAQSSANGRCLLVGPHQHVPTLARYVEQRGGRSLRIVGYVDTSGRGRQLIVHTPTDTVPRLGSIEHLGELVERTEATDLVVAVPPAQARRLRSSLERIRPRRETLRVYWIDEGASGHDSTGLVRLAPGRRVLDWPRLLKRALDLMGAFLGLLLLSPLLVTIAVVILVTSGRPILYCQERVGHKGRRFRIYKFRSMRTDAEQATGPIWAQDHDDRCTRIGNWLRRTNIDELPQLLNVLKGEMSLVGPRPERPVFVERFTEELEGYAHRLAVPAGMTGWAQVHGWRGRTSLEKRLEFDLEYIRTWSVGLDLRILLMTVEHVLWGKTRWDREQPAS